MIIKIMNVAILSNSYGEDRSGALIGRNLKKFNKNINIIGFPLISLGEEYKKRNIKVIGGHPPPPSGGFFLKSLKGLLLDLIRNFYIPISYITKLHKLKKDINVVVVVGDTPLLFLGYIALHKKAYFLDQCKSNLKAPHLPIERFFIKRLTKAIFVHDQITSEFLKKFGINAQFLGNPMMDELLEERKYNPPRGKILIGLLPGSRKEAYKNMELILKVVLELLKEDEKLHFAVALSETIEKEKLPKLSKELKGKIDFCYGSFVDIVKKSKIVISLAGTASEQALYLGTPVVSFKGGGAQNSRRRIKAQKKLLGEAFLVFKYNPKKIAKKILEIIQDKELLDSLILKGRKRAGPEGGARNIAKFIYLMESA
ncbi:MAG: lipid-A-disaccharide synthase-related protein [candidate division WOR-3 bacterium]